MSFYYHSQFTISHFLIFMSFGHAFPNRSRARAEAALPRCCSVPFACKGNCLHLNQLLNPVEFINIILLSFTIHYYFFFTLCMFWHTCRPVARTQVGLLGLRCACLDSAGDNVVCLSRYTGSLTPMQLYMCIYIPYIHR